ncbi:hypothetical protein PM082_005915 [Marasmius tenuissimus]|nr:hypothetical protein PM082_005915 [Marasmius tenuissimus]
MFDPPRGLNYQFLYVLKSYLSVLISYTTSPNGVALVDEVFHSEKRDPTCLEILPSILQLLVNIRFNNRAYLIRNFVQALFFREALAQERLELRATYERLVSIAPHLELDDSVQGAADRRTLTPFLVSQHGMLAVEWHPVSSPPPHVIP